MKFKVKVTKEILKETMHCSGNNRGEVCAIAHAVRDLMPHASVGTLEIFPFYGRDKSFYNKIKLLQEATDFIYLFDETLPGIRPFIPELEFEIDINDEILERLVDINEIKELLRESKTLEIVNA